MSERISRAAARELITTVQSHALVRLAALLYERQTAEERTCQQTFVRNGVGYNKADAFPVARFLARHARGVSPAQLDIESMRARLMKYASQLAHILLNRHAEVGSRPKAPELDLERAIRLPFSTWRRYPHTIWIRVAHSRGTSRRTLYLPRKHTDLTEHDDGAATIYVPLWWLRRNKLVDENDVLLIKPAGRATIARKSTKLAVPGMSLEKRKQLRLALGGQGCG